MLTIDTAAQYLIDRGLLTVQSILDGELMITDAARRNRNLRVTRRDGPGYLIKQPDDPAHGGWHSLRCEAAFYSLCQEVSALAEARALLPRLLYADSDEALVALELLADALPLWSHYNQFDAAMFPIATAGAVGRAIGTVHHAFHSLHAAGDPRIGWLSRAIPWILQVHKPGPELLASISPANYQTLQILQTQQDLSRHLDALRHLWQPQSIIHNDIKSDNILVLPVGENYQLGTPDVRLVDWELAQIGDPAWDVAGALQDFVLFWILSMPSAPSVDAMVANARYPLPVLQSAIRALWHGYRDATRATASQANALLLRAVRFSAARLIQSAYEMGQSVQALPAPSVLMLQIAANILADPAAGQVQLYGLFQQVGV